MKIVPINNLTHRALKVRKSRGFSHAKNQHFVDITAFEIIPSSMVFPLVFMKNPETGQFRCVALLGLETGENLFFEQGNWINGYIPMNITCAPFTMIDSGKNDDTALVCINEKSPYVNMAEGEALFDSEGNQTAFLDNVTLSLSQMHSHQHNTQLFIKKLIELPLLVPLSVSMTHAQGEEIKLMDNAYTVSEKRLRELSDEQTLELFKADYLGSIYSLINSLELMQRMVALKNKVSANPITKIKIDF